MSLINLSIDSKFISSLIKKISFGDESSFNIFYNKTSKVVFGTAFSITKSITESEDIVQNVYIKIIENSKTYKDDKKPLAWIYTITRNEAINSIRKSKKNMDIEREEYNVIFSVIENNLDRLILKSALEILSDEELQIVLLHNSGLKHKEIANMLDKRLSTILSKYNRSINKMREFLEKK